MSGHDGICHEVVWQKGIFGVYGHCRKPAKYVLRTDAGTEYPRCGIHVRRYRADSRYTIVAIEPKRC